MTQIRFDGMRMTAKGHAGSGPFGSDVVCAGMSTLFVTVAEVILEMRDDGKLQRDPEVQLCPGDVILGMEPTTAGMDKAQNLWDFLLTGCQMIADSYPQYVVITEAEADE